jgi:hypothetical protein
VPWTRAPNPQTAAFSRALASYTGTGTAKIWDGGPTDFNIAEDFPVEDLVRVLRAFADGQGSNILTVTCASAKTFADAPGRLEKYDLLRVRMGGWSEFFTSMFPMSQQQHLRRLISTPTHSAKRCQPQKDNQNVSVNAQSRIGDAANRAVAQMGLKEPTADPLHKYGCGGIMRLRLHRLLGGQ